MINELEQLGMATNDAKVYQALMQLGTAGGGEISRRTGFHRNIVYESADRLMSKKLITRVYRKKIALFQISDPNRLLYEANARAQLAEKLVKEIREKSSVASDITIYDGEEGFRTFWASHMARMKEGDQYYVVGSLGQLWFSLMEPILPWFIKQAKKKKISIKGVAHVINNKDNILLKSGIKYQTRLMPIGYQVPSNANIWGDYVWLQTAVPPYSIIDIYNPVLAKAYKATFDEYWSLAEEYPKK